MRRFAAALVVVYVSVAAAALAQAPPPSATPGTAPVITLGGTASARSFDGLWAEYKKASDDDNEEVRLKAFQNIRWYRTERNIRSLDFIALALVARGQDQLKKGNAEKAEGEFRSAIMLDPHLPDAHFGLARAQMAKGGMGILSSLDDMAAGMLARVPTAQGRYSVLALAVAIGLVTLFATGTVFALVAILRHGALFVHDIEESLGLGSRTAAMGVFTVFLFVPMMTLQGYGWLPLWWMVLLFVYMTRFEQVLSVLFLASSLTVAPAAALIESYVAAQQNPLLRASVRTIEAGPDSRAFNELAAGVEGFPEDRDLKYLLALQHKKAGRYDDAKKLYEALEPATTRDAAEPKDGVALNNFANILFAEGREPQAQVLYARAAKVPSSAAFMATYYYNLSLAHLQKFEYDPSKEARGTADDHDKGLVATYEALWKADRGGGTEVAAPVDLAPTPDEVWGKFVGVRDGVGKQNAMGMGASLLAPVSVAEMVLNRFTVFLALFPLVALALGRWRGSKAFTLRCQKCGTPFCRKCQLTAAVTGLCTQCHHLFVVRDGVSGPARNQKLLEVQKEENRRQRVFRLLALVSPGAGQIYGQRAYLGVPIVALWYMVLAVIVLGGRVVSFTDAPSGLLGPWGMIIAGLLLLLLYVLGHQLPPNFDFDIPVQQRAPRRMPAARAS